MKILKNNQITSSLNNLFPNINLSRISYQETQISDNEDYEDDNDNELVYITNSGSCYHNKYCRYLWKSCIPIKKKDAISRGYHSCSRC